MDKQPPIPTKSSSRQNLPRLDTPANASRPSSGGSNASTGNTQMSSNDTSTPTPKNTAESEDFIVSPLRSLLQRGNTLLREDSLLRRTLSTRSGADSPMVAYNPSPYPDRLGSPVVQDKDSIFITAATTVPSASLPRTPKTPGIPTPVKHIYDPSHQMAFDSQATMALPDLEKQKIELTKPNQWRAFSRRAYSFQKRQWFTNICCISLCPFFIILSAFTLQTIISKLVLDGIANDYQIVYCSKVDSINQQLWAVYNTSGGAVKKLDKSSFKGATKTVRHVNFLEKSTFVDLSSVGGLTRYAAVSLTSSSPCVQWFGTQYPITDGNVYALPVQPKHGLYTNQILDGWLDVLAAAQALNDPNDIYSRQSFSLARTYTIYQTRPWYIVAKAAGIPDSAIGSVPPQQPLSSPDSIPTAIPFFKKTSEANGILDTIEPRWFTKVNISPLGLGGYEKVPYFLTNFSDTTQLNRYITDSVERTVSKLEAIDTSAITSDQGDLALAQILGQLQDALQSTPYGSIFFKAIDHARKAYSYVLQFGTDNRIQFAPAFPLVGLRRLIAQSQIANGILRFSGANLASTVITQGIRAFPLLSDPTPNISYGAIIGRILYPLGISFLLPIFTIALVREKEAKIVVMLRMNGLADVSGYYISQYCTFFLNYLVSTFIFIASALALGLELFTKTSIVVIIIVFLLWGNIQISLSFLFCAFFKSSRTAVIGVSLITISGVIASYILDQVFLDSDDYPYWLFAWPPLAFYRALGVLNKYATASKLPAYTFAMITNPGDPVQTSIIVMLFEIAIILALSIYLTQVLPQEFGPSRPWNFPFQRAVYDDFETRTAAIVDNAELVKEDEDVKAERHRVNLNNYNPQTPLIVQGMRKQYGENVVVKSVTFAVDKGVVFGLLGPNGAGKTSLISILTGIHRPTLGSAKLGGYDMESNPVKAFQSIGVCPQFDILWDDLTVEEHLYFYARLKGVPIELEREAAQAAVELVGLDTQREMQIKHISGGQRRRVSIAIALVSDPMVVFLDEPTTGLDPEVRRTVWDTIARARAGRAILLTTHSMEEAEVCCQKIGVMARGTMRCFGSAVELKAKYRPGYNLEITFQNALAATQLVEAALPPGWILVQDMAHHRVYTFEPSGDQLAYVFDIMSKRAVQSGILTWGVSQTTLDEVFTAILGEEDM